MHKQIQYLLLVSIFLFFSCSPYGTTVCQGFSYLKAPESSLGIVFVDSILVDYEGSVENEFGEGDSSKLIKRFITSQLRVDIGDSTCFSNVYLFPDFSDTGLIERNVNGLEGKQTLYLKLPDAGETFTADNKHPRYILFLEDFRIVSEIKVSVYAYGLIPVAVPKKPMILSCRYGIWDNTAGKLICYGKKRVEYASGPRVDRRTWNTACALFVHELFNKTPFYHWRYH